MKKIKIRPLTYIALAISVIAIITSLTAINKVTELVRDVENHAEKIHQIETNKNGSVTDPKKPYYALTDEDRDIVERVVAAESLSEPYEGQKAVAQCILNTALNTGKTPAEVVLAPGQYATPLNEEEVSERVKSAVADIFDEGNLVTAEPIQYFYAPKWCDSEWHESLPFVMQIGGHRFFTEG